MNQPNTEIITFQGGNGSSISDAIEIVGAKSFFSSIQAEFEYIQNVCGENNVECAEGKTIIFPNAAIHHVNVVTKNGEIKNIFFNATGFHAQIVNEDIEAVKTFTAIN